MLIVVLVISYILILRNYNKKEKEFVDYLSSNSDTAGLDAMGLINKYGIREERWNTFKQISGEKLWNRYNETNDSKYMDFSDDFDFYVRAKAVLFVLIFLAIAFFFIITGTLE